MLLLWPIKSVTLQPSRRGFMLGAGALALTAALGRPGIGAKRRRKTVPDRRSSPSVAADLCDRVERRRFGDPLMKNWTIEKSLADMDKAGIATSMLSVTTPASISPRAMPRANSVASRTNMPPSWSRIIPAGSAISRCCRSPTSKAACAN
jgi:hypothetical protein